MMKKLEMIDVWYIKRILIMSLWISEKGIKYILSPKRGMATDINAKYAQTLTAVGQSNWTGSFISPDIDHIEKSTTIGSNIPVKICMKNGKIIYFDGENFIDG